MQSMCDVVTALGCELASPRLGRIDGGEQCMNVEICVSSDVMRDIRCGAARVSVMMIVVAPPNMLDGEAPVERKAEGLRCARARTCDGSHTAARGTEGT